MKNLLIKSHLPPATLGDAQLLVCVGVVGVHIEDPIDIRVGTEIVRDRAVVDRVVCEILDTPETFLRAFGSASFSQFRSELSRAVGTALPAETTITILVVKETIEELPATSEEEESDQGDVVDLIFSLEDDDEEVEETED